MDINLEWFHWPQKFKGQCQQRTSALKVMQYNTHFFNCIWFECGGQNPLLKVYAYCEIHKKNLVPKKTMQQGKRCLRLPYRNAMYIKYPFLQMGIVFLKTWVAFVKGGWRKIKWALCFLLLFFLFLSSFPFLQF